MKYIQTADYTYTITFESPEELKNFKKFIKEDSSLKAKEVMELLDISRQTLSNYVKQGLIKIDTVINGKYRYNKNSVFALLNK